jgi:hypothetical protein
MDFHKTYAIRSALLSLAVHVLFLWAVTATLSGCMSNIDTSNMTFEQKMQLYNAMKANQNARDYYNPVYIAPSPVNLSAPRQPTNTTTRCTQYIPNTMQCESYSY